MDFLNRYRVEIDYRKKNVQSSLDGSDEFTLEEGRVLSTLINSVQTIKMLSKRCIEYLTHIVSKLDEAVPSVRATYTKLLFRDI